MNKNTQHMQSCTHTSLIFGGFFDVGRMSVRASSSAMAKHDFKKSFIQKAEKPKILTSFLLVLSHLTTYNRVGGVNLTN